MRFSTTSILTSLLAGTALGQTPAQTSQAAADIASYLSEMETNPTFLSVFAALATQPALASQVAAYESAAMAGEAIDMPAADILSVLPADQQAFISSVAVAEISILSKDGILATSGAASATGTATSAATGTITGTATSTSTASASASKSKNGTATTTASAATGSTSTNAATGGLLISASAGGLLAMVAVVLAL